MKITITGIESAAGALYEGTELAPNAIRQAGLAETLTSKGFKVEDNGNINIIEHLPRHNIGPVRNWPAPRLIWEAIAQDADRLFSEKVFSIILGGDCSIVVGAFSAFKEVYGENSYLVVFDGHIDTVAPKGSACIGAAGMGLWFLTQDNQVWWTNKPLPSEQIKVIGPHTVAADTYGIEVLPYELITANNGLELAGKMLEKVPEDANIFIHFDVDVLNENVMPAAYSPSEKGLELRQAEALLKVLFKDRRVKGIEITEFSANKDDNGQSAEAIIDLLSSIEVRLDS